jgi:ribonuclease P protein component
MLTRFHRLNFSLKSDRDLLHTGTLQKEPFFLLAYDFRGKTFQFGVMIPKKIISQATARNDLRRTITMALPRQFVELSKLRLALRLTSNEVVRMNQADWQDFFTKLLKKLADQ